MCQDGCRGDPVFEFRKRFFLVRSPTEIPWISLQQFCYWLGNFKQVLDEPAVKIPKTNKNLYFLYRPW